MNSIYVALLLIVIAVPIALGLYAWWRARAAPPVPGDDPEALAPDSLPLRPTSLAEPEVALRIEREQ